MAPFVLPPLTSPAPDPIMLAQYDGLASGAIQGGNFQHFKDLAELGAVPDSVVGYGIYLQYNAGSVGSVGKDIPEYVGWNKAATGAYAIANNYHQADASSPLWTPDAWVKAMAPTFARVASQNGWDATQAQRAIDSFVVHFPRLLLKWGYRGTPVTTEASVRSALLLAIAPSSPAVAVPAPAPIQSREIVEFLVSRDPASGYGASGDGIHFPVVVYRVNTEQPIASGQFTTVGRWVRWDGVINKIGSQTTKVAFWEDVRDEITRSLGYNDPRAANYYNWAELQLAVRAIKGPPPPTTTVDVLADPSSTSLYPVTLPPGAPYTGVPKISSPIPSGSTSTQPPPVYDPTIDPVTLPPIPKADPTSMGNTTYTPPTVTQPPPPSQTGDVNAPPVAPSQSIASEDGGNSMLPLLLLAAAIIGLVLATKG